MDQPIEKKSLVEVTPTTASDLASCWEAFEKNHPSAAQRAAIAKAKEQKERRTCSHRATPEAPLCDECSHMNAARKHAEQLAQLAFDGLLGITAAREEATRMLAPLKLRDTLHDLEVLSRRVMLQARTWRATLGPEVE